MLCSLIALQGSSALTLTLRSLGAEGQSSKWQLEWGTELLGAGKAVEEPAQLVWSPGFGQQVSELLRCHIPHRLTWVEFSWCPTQSLAHSGSSTAPYLPFISLSSLVKTPQSGEDSVFLQF